MKHTILIAGLGLIGGSLAKGMTESNQNHVIGYDVNLESLEYAYTNRIIHESAKNFHNAAELADFIILAAPISETIELMKKLNDIPLKENVIVSDTASVKCSIIETAGRLTNKNITFIGGHPMAGSHKKGVQAAKAHLFENAIYVLTPSVNSTPDKVDALKDILRHAKSKFIILNPDEHDEMTGVVSHFPHLIASSLVQQARKWGETHSYLPNLAAGGFRDITRIASSNPKMWQDIFSHNRGKMSQLLGEWINEMHFLKELVDKNDKEDIISYLDTAKTYRDGLGTEEKGVIPAFYDIYVDIRDQAGALASVTQILANENISINNIQILEIREGITGALRLSLSSKEAQRKSLSILQNKGYEIMIQR
ncbi:prephenate dehydrogenase [Virgibacillus indicus]|uniref:prephenate dehydrogenase n=1 Tax=Virgibacillus indicus TaxID=2024554 RepID=UPI00197D3405|nr:prephenate dehydrogenase [Virgibacillus indicus]